ncbi:single-stranded DNA-binding protein, putative [Plasmodium knowlesi strain H]|uniref:Single-stranded DNA-binding protein, putative n=3 Tax=Plasmodium knowlesi TaxID=5850 RepID=A0A5K1UXS1_PLAKH|nr:single-stranded DNA-binding protein, putative [Plasmodium knowlesi strain H]OTN67199.1 putative Single-strand binding protein [Plasmodium knowlesi]CAA9988752.1 single-stranded DNA-binding protein, putative [Plasmodium knowlesi strain H]SBO21702.1 single-stranded DNA-binding protein, putative [Plasmodium knowlesi strain H]SBO22081.1 single-stranded DNA-binding protein, putative [Plasmodium knowlesi strain H]VVS78226.1 single-stranded DNA-binding protein, putative [Plasmodium knowlesi strain |eukprot:XP_002259728.1 single-strand binding protein, putative [Plasmodium knowlesi strain H]
MKALLLSTVMYVLCLPAIWGYVGEPKMHKLTMGGISNQRRTSTRKMNLLKTKMQSDFNYEGSKRYYNNRPMTGEKSLNKISLIGRVGCEPDIKILNGGDKVATFSLATNEFWRDRNTNELKSKTDWHRIVVYDQNIVDLVDKFLRKGRRVYIQGSLHTRRWFGNDLTNQPRQITEVVLSYNKGDLIFLDDKRNFISRNTSNVQSTESASSSNEANIANSLGGNADEAISASNSDSHGGVEQDEFAHGLEGAAAEGFDSLEDGLGKEDGIYDKMNTQEFDE